MRRCPVLAKRFCSRVPHHYAQGDASEEIVDEVVHLPVDLLKAVRQCQL